jgi:uncharacterized protein (UPF0276 family)
MPEEAFWQAAGTLFESKLVDIVEWSFDTCWQRELLPEELALTIDAFSKGGALLGHGIFYSTLSAAQEPLPSQKMWLEQLKQECKQRSYKHISEHFGFLESKNWRVGSHLPVPSCEAAILQGRRSLELIQDACGLPVGLENLALAFSIDDVFNQGSMLDEILRPLNGFLLLDLHNIYCQSLNFSVSMAEILDTMPLDLVKEIHLSGGSFQNNLRRDTHDDGIPHMVIEILPGVLQSCPNLEYVIVERLGNSLLNKTRENDFRNEFIAVRDLVTRLKAAAYG